MATIDRYKLLIEVSGQQAVDSLKSKVEGLNNSILAVSGASLAGLITSSLRFADSIQDVADATGIAGGKIMALGTAMQAAGGDAKDVGKMINKFYQNLDEMAQGSDSAEEALKRVGIGFQDLRTLSAEALLEKSIANLAKMEAGARRTAAGIAIFGKAFGLIDPKKLEEIFKTQDVTKLNAEIQKAADIVQAFETSFLNLQKATLTAINGIIGNADDLTLSLEDAEKVLKAVAVAFAIAFGAKIIANLVEVGRLIVAVNNALKITALIQTALAALSGPKGWIGIAAAIVTATGALFAFNKESEKVEGLNLSDPELAAKSYGMAIAVLQKQVAAGKLSVQEFQKQVEMMSKAPGMPKMEAGAFKDPSPDTSKDVENRQRAAAAAKLTTEELRNQNRLQNEYNTRLNQLIGNESTRANIIRSNLLIENDLQNNLLRLDTQINTEKAKGRDVNAGVITQLRAQREELIKNAEAVKQIRKEEIERNRLLQLSSEWVQYFAQYTQDMAKITDIGTRIQTLDDLMNKNNQSSTQQLDQAEQLRKINLQGSYARLNAQEALDAAILSGDEEKIKKAKEYYDQQIKHYDSLYNATNKLFATEDAVQQSRIAGIKTAFEQIGASMTPFQMAQDAVTQTFNTMASSLDTFVREGTFKFKDFARSILLDIGLMIAKMYMFQAIQAGLGAFGIGLPGIPGKAMGGPVGKGMPYMVGERGPELFVPKQAGTIIPNNKLDSAPATAPQAPGPVTNVYNNYSISAIDSQSVAQFFAQNRKMALGAVTMAQKELSYGS